MTIKVRSRREKVGSGLGLLLGIIGFNLLVLFSLKCPVLNMVYTFLPHKWKARWDKV